MLYGQDNQQGQKNSRNFLKLFEIFPKNLKIFRCPKCGRGGVPAPPTLGEVYLTPS